MVRPAAQTPHRYTVQTGDTLSGIAQQFYGYASDWIRLYRANSSAISDPNVIYTGQVLSVPADPPPAAVRSGIYQPRHAAGTATPTARTPTARTATTGSVSWSGQHAIEPGGGRQSGPACSASDGTVPQNYAAIVDFLTAHGYTAVAAAGIAGNIYQESGGNPESVGSGGGGLIGFTPLPSGLVTGNPSADLQAQLEAVLSYNQQWAQYIPALNAATSAAAAADIYMNDFERPGIPAASNREAAAEAVAQACGI